MTVIEEPLVFMTKALVVRPDELFNNQGSILVLKPTLELIQLTIEIK